MAKRWTDDATLVDAISQNIFEALPVLPKRLVRVDALTREYGMPFSHIQILCMLAEGEMTIGEISSGLNIAKPNITPLLDSLHERGILERRRSETDRRIVYVRLLPEGQDLVARIRQSIATQLEDWPEGFNTSDIKRLNNALAYLIEVSRMLTEKERSR